MEVDVTQVAWLLWTKINLFFDQSTLWLVVKFFLLVYVVVLLVDIVLMLVLKGLSADLKTALYGSNRPLHSKNKTIKRWETIRERLESGNPSQYKVAVLEADALADEMLTGIGYKGATMAEKLGAVRGGQLETKELLAQAHEARNQIIHDPHFSLSREEALGFLDSFEKFFHEIELF
jgi:ABC-type lipoprotein release transport system permease subunit